MPTVGIFRPTVLGPQHTREVVLVDPTAVPFYDISDLQYLPDNTVEIFAPVHIFPVKAFAPYGGVAVHSNAFIASGLDLLSEIEHFLPH